MTSKKGRKLTDKEAAAVLQVIEEKDNTLIKANQRSFIKDCRGRYLDRKNTIYHSTAAQLYKLLGKDERLQFLQEIIDLQDPFEKVVKAIREKHREALRDYLRQQRREYEKASSKKRNQIIGRLEESLQRPLNLFP